MLKLFKLKKILNLFSYNLVYLSLNFKEFDYIIVDCSSIGLVTDALLLSRHTDMVLYVVRQRFTYKKQLNIIQGLANDRKFKKVDVVFNDVKAIAGYGYGYGYGGVVPGTLTLKMGLGDVTNSIVSNVGNDNSVRKVYRK